MNITGLSTLINYEIYRMFRVANQTLLAPLIGAFLYIFIFGQIVGQRIGSISGVSYIDFVIPGLLMMNLMNGSLMHTSSSIYLRKFLRNIDEILTAPFSYLEILVGFLAAGVVRGLLVGGGVYALALFFTLSSIEHLVIFLLYAISVSIIFSLAGLLVGLWAENFEQLSIPSVYIIMPFTFLGGLFNSITMLPEKFQFFVHLNPFFYFVDGIRYSMVGISESNLAIGWALIFGLILALGSLTWYLFKIGWRIRS